MVNNGLEWSLTAMFRSIFFGIPIIAISIAIIFIWYFGDPSLMLSLHGLLAFMLYSVLSLVTGIRYRMLISEITKIKPDLVETAAIPAAMNLMSFILPFKGGGLWLLFHLKTAHSIDLIRASWLALINVYLMISVAAALYISWFLLESITAFPVLFTTLLLFFGISLSSVFLHNRLSPSKKSIRLIWASFDSVLVAAYLLILFALVYVVSPSRESDIIFALLIMSLFSLAVKVTPGNIGVLEGFGLLLYSFVEEHGAAFTNFVATYRLLSIVHAVAVGLPALTYLTNRRNLYCFFESIKSRYFRRST